MEFKIEMKILIGIHDYELNQEMIDQWNKLELNLISIDNISQGNLNIILSGKFENLIEYLSSRGEFKELRKKSLMMMIIDHYFID